MIYGRITVSQQYQKKTAEDRIPKGSSEKSDLRSDLANRLNEIMIESIRIDQSGLANRQQTKSHYF
jgi:hypothetical protein